MVRIGICDDNLDVCTSLAKKVRAQIPDADLALYSSAEELLEAEKVPEILFLDIMLDGMDGMQAARRLRERNADTGIIFISGSPDHVFDAFDVDAVHYLIKPFDDIKLRQVLKKARVRLEKQQDLEPQLLISRRGEHISVRHRDIHWAEVFNRTVVLHTSRGDISYYGRLGDLQRELGDDFFRTHRACLVNCRYVDAYDTRSVKVGSDTVPLAKANHASFIEHYMRYIRRQGASS